MHNSGTPAHDAAGKPLVSPGTLRALASIPAAGGQHAGQLDCQHPGHPPLEQAPVLTWRALSCRALPRVTACAFR
jgi:hypothetical protein